MIRWGRIIATMGTAVMLAATMLAGSAAAQPRAAAPPEIQLTESQKKELQAEVDKHLKDYGGGKQIGINEIAYEDGAMILTLPLPGEAKARSVNEPVTPLGTANCSYEYACLWSDTNFNGSRLSRWACGTVTLGSPFNSTVGSIHNNQTTGTQTVLLNSARQVLNASMAPSRISDTGVGSRWSARYWVVC